MPKTLRSPLVLAVIQRKGGVGKTTVMHHLAVGLALSGYDVLAIEADDNPRLRAILEGMQASQQHTDAAQTTYGLLANPEYGLGGFAHTVYLDRLWQDIPHINAGYLDAVRGERHWALPGTFRYVPGSEKIKEIENLFARRAQSAEEGDVVFRPSQQLARALEAETHRNTIILIDAPPSLTYIWSNIVFAATHVIVPVDFDFASPEDFERTFNAYRDARAKGATAHMLGVALNKYNARNEDHVDLMRAYTEDHQEIVNGRLTPAPALLRTTRILGTIPLENDLLNRAARHNRTLHQYAPRSECGQALWHLTQNVMIALGLES